MQSNACQNFIVNIYQILLTVVEMKWYVPMWCVMMEVWMCVVYFNILKICFANMFCVGYNQSILHGDYINIL